MNTSTTAPATETATCVARQAVQLPLAMTLSERVVVLIPGRLYPRLAIDLAQRMDGWWSSLACMDDDGGMELWRGPYGNPEAAERNAAAYGRQFCRARGLTRHADFLTRHYGFRP